MINFIKTGQAFYGIGMIAYGIQSIITRDFRPAIIPEFPIWVHQYAIFPYITGGALVAAGILISGLFKIEATIIKTVCLYLGFYFLILIITCHFPTRFLISPYSAKHLGLWTDALKELALAGGAFVMAGTYSENTFTAGKTKSFTSILGRLIPFGRIFFSITMVCFGIDHFLYTETVAGLVPTWFGAPNVWAHISGVALIGAGLAIIFKIWTSVIGFLLALTLFIWFLSLHIPRAIANPYMFKGNEIVSAFDALVFSGIALVIANTKKEFRKIFQ